MNRRCVIVAMRNNLRLAREILDRSRSAAVIRHMETGSSEPVPQSQYEWQQSLPDDDWHTELCTARES